MTNLLKCEIWSLLDYLYHQNQYKIIGIYLSRQTNMSISQQINLAGKLVEDHCAMMFFITEKQQKTSELSLSHIKHSRII